LVASVAQLVEQLTLNQLVLGSSPSRGTNFPLEIEDSGLAPKDSPNISASLGPETEQDVKFPKRLRYKGKGKALATIYRREGHPQPYRLYWRARVDGKPRSQFKDFPTYSAAKKKGDTVIEDLAKGAQAARLSEKQAADALAASERLHRFYVDTGRQISLLASVSEYCEAAGRLPGGHSIAEAVERFLAHEAVVQRKPLGEAVTEFVAGRKHLGESKNGERSKRSPVYLYNTAMWLKEFAGTFPGHAVCDLAREHLNSYIGKFKELSAKSRNDRRAIVKQFLGWCVAKDYLAQNHRLLEAVDFKTEEQDQHEIDFYRPKELRAMLATADEDLAPVIALGGLGGLRREEILRLRWPDVWRVKGKVEIGPQIAKGRKRRLVDICRSLAAWLRPYRKATGPIWSKSPDALEEALATLRDGLKIPARRNGLRHGFCSYHFALHGNENLTAAEAGNSPQMLHDHYRGLVTRAEAAKWFRIRPARTAGATNVIPMDEAAEK
jgi:integrase